MFLRHIKEEILVDLKYLIAHPLFLSLVAFIAGIILILFQDMPPRRLVMVSDTTWGGYAEQYKKIFENNGIELVLFPSTGSEDTARRLMDINDPVQVGFTVSGTINPNEAKNISSMGTVYISPLWVFYRKKIKTGKILKLTDFQGKRINIEEVGTKANSLAKKLFSLNGIDIDYHISQLNTAAAIDSMGKGTIDVVMFFSSPAADNVKRLVNESSVELMNVERADSYSFMYDYLEKLVIPEGGLDMAKNVPVQETQVIAAPVELIVKNNLHPALKMLLMKAASEVHGRETYFYREGSFPSFGRKLLPEDEEAKLYYKYGIPDISKYLPFWAVEPFYKVFLYALPVSVFIFAVMKNLSEYRLSRGRRKIFSIYERLRALEKEAPSCTNIADRKELNAMLSSCEQEATGLRLPEELVGEYFTLINNISNVRSRLFSSENTFQGSKNR